MPITFIPFGELSPDQKLFNNNANGALLECVNVVPVFNHYVASPTVTSSIGVGGISGLVQGGHSHSTGNDTYKLYFGQIGLFRGLLEADFSTGLTTDRTRLAGVYSSPLDAVSGWQFTSYGSSVFATNFLDDIQILQPGDTRFSKSNLTAPPGSAGANAAAASDPKARFITSIKNHLLIGHYSVGGVTTPTGVWWSGIDTPRYFGLPGVNQWLSNSDQQPLEDEYGHVSGLSSGGDWAIIFKERSVVRMEGPPFYFRTIVRGTGCRFPNSIIQVGDDTYYWGEAGPTVLRGGEGPPVALGASGMIRTLIDNATGFSSLSVSSTLQRTDMYGASDAANSLVFWSYFAQGPPAVYIVLAYNYAENRFSFLTDIGTGGTVGGTKMILTVPDTGETWRPGRDVAVVNQVFPGPTFEIVEYVAKTSAASSASPRFRTAFYELSEGTSSRVIRVRPIYSMNSGGGGLAVTATVNTRDRPYGDQLTDQSSAQDSHGWISLPKSYSGHFHQFLFQFASQGGKLPSDAVELDGFEVDFAGQGAK